MLPGSENSTSKYLPSSPHAKFGNVVVTNRSDLPDHYLIIQEQGPVADFPEVVAIPPSEPHVSNQQVIQNLRRVAAPSPFPLGSDYIHNCVRTLAVNETVEVAALAFAGPNRALAEEPDFIKGVRQVLADLNPGVNL